jgi:hypothetical protein
MLFYIRQLTIQSPGLGPAKDLAPGIYTAPCGGLHPRFLIDTPNLRTPQSVLMYGDQQSMWPDGKSHGSRSNFRKLLAEKPAEVARIEQKCFGATCRVHRLFTTFSWCSLIPYFLDVYYSNRHIPHVTVLILQTTLKNT